MPAFSALALLYSDQKVARNVRDVAGKRLREPDDPTEIYYFKLESSDKKLITVASNVARKSILLNDILEMSTGGYDDVPLPLVTGKILEIVLEWCKAHVDDDPNKERTKRTDDISHADATWVGNFDQATLFDLIEAANYLNIPHLLDLTCKTVANMIKGKSAEEIRAQFGIANDLTPEEEAIIQQENEWIEDIKT